MVPELGKKQLIINIAKELFYANGYNTTSIQNIIDRANIAKGTFYHYFKSKDDLLNQLTEGEISVLYKYMYRILDMDFNAVDKLNMLFQSASGWKSENLKIIKVLVRSIMSDANLQLRNTMFKQTIEKMFPIYKSILLQGVGEGIFNITDTDYCAKFILTSFLYNSEEIQQYMLVDNYTQEVLLGLKKLIFNYENTLERILGAKQGVIHIINDEVLEKLLKGLLEA